MAAETGSNSKAGKAGAKMNYRIRLEEDLVVRPGSNRLKRFSVFCKSCRGFLRRERKSHSFEHRTCKSLGDHRPEIGIPSKPLNDNADNPPTAAPFRPISTVFGFFPEERKSPRRSPANECVWPLLGPSTNSWLHHATASFGNIAFGSLNLRLELVRELQFILQEIVQPVAQRFLFGSGQPLHLFFDLFEH